MLQALPVADDSAGGQGGLRRSAHLSQVSGTLGGCVLSGAEQRSTNMEEAKASHSATQWLLHLWAQREITVHAACLSLKELTTLKDALL